MYGETVCFPPLGNLDSLAQGGHLRYGTNGTRYFCCCCVVDVEECRCFSGAKHNVNSAVSCTPVGFSFPLINGSWAKWALWGSPSTRDRDPSPGTTRDLERTLVRFLPSSRSRGSWLADARIVPRASGAVALSGSGRSSALDPDGARCLRTVLPQDADPQAVSGDSRRSTDHYDHIGGPDAGSRIYGGPGTLERGWADLGAALHGSGLRTGSVSSRTLDSGPPWLLDAHGGGSGWWLSKATEASRRFVR